MKIILTIYLTGVCVQIRFIPVNAQCWADVIQLHDAMAFLMKCARGDSRTAILDYTRPFDNRICAGCGSKAAIEVHHIKPVWVYALEIVLSFPLETKPEQRLLAQRVVENKGKILACNDASNFVPVCKSCHSALGKVTDRTWKERFEAKYRVIFGIRRVTEVEKLFIRQKECGMTKLAAAELVILEAGE